MAEQLTLLTGTPIPPREWVTDTPPEQCPREIIVQISRYKYIRATFLTHERRFAQKAGNFVEFVLFTRLTPQLTLREALYQVAKTSEGSTNE